MLSTISEKSWNITLRKAFTWANSIETGPSNHTDLHEKIGAERKECWRRMNFEEWFEHRDKINGTFWSLWVGKEVKTLTWWISGNEGSKRKVKAVYSLKVWLEAKRNHWKCIVICQKESFKTGNLVVSGSSNLWSL